MKKVLFYIRSNPFQYPPLLSAASECERVGMDVTILGTESVENVFRDKLSMKCFSNT